MTDEFLRSLSKDALIKIIRDLEQERDKVERELENVEYDQMIMEELYANEVGHV